METIPSFAPLASRLAAHAAAIRPVDGARDDWAKVAALVICALLEMLICVCAALDARAPAEIRPAATATLRDKKVAPVPAPRAGFLVLPGERRVSLRKFVPEVSIVAPKLAATPEAAPTGPGSGPGLAWSRDVGVIGAIFAVPWRPRRETQLFRQPLCTPVLFRYRN